VGLLTCRGQYHYEIMTNLTAPEIDVGKYDKRRQALIVSRDAFNYHDQGSLGTDASVSLARLGTYEMIRGSKHTERYSRLIHIVYVLLQTSLASVVSASSSGAGLGVGGLPA
jgi:hypothetical protein